MTLRVFDIVVIALYFAGVLALGLWFSKRNKNTEHYFLGGRDFPGWAIGISFVGAMVSSVTFIALPADSFKTTWVRYLPHFAFPVVVLICAYVFIPFFRRGTVTSAYQYLDLRFGPSVSVYGAFVFLGLQIVRTASVLYLMAMLMATLTGISVETALLVAGGVTALYTIKGGFEAVVWTDVIQTIVLVLGGLVVIVVAVNGVEGGLGAIFSQALDAGKLSFVKDLNPKTGTLEPIASGFSLTEKTAVMLMLVGFTQFIAGKLNQESVQRWCSAKSAHEARKSMLVLGVCSLPVWAIFMFIGTCLWAYYQKKPDAVSSAILSGAEKAEGILPHFIATALPAGVAGVVIAAALAAAMSTLSSAINSASMVVVNDLYKRFSRVPRGDLHYLRAGRLSSLLVSAMMIAIAFVFLYSDSKTVTEFTIIITAIFGGGIGGIFLMGMLSRKGDARAVLVGIAVVLLFTAYALLTQYKVIPPLFNPYYTSIIGNILMIVVTYVAALFMPARKRDMTNLTVWDMDKNKNM